LVDILRVKQQPKSRTRHINFTSEYHSDTTLSRQRTPLSQGAKML